MFQKILICHFLGVNSLGSDRVSIDWSRLILLAAEQVHLTNWHFLSEINCFDAALLISFLVDDRALGRELVEVLLIGWVV